MNSGHFLPFDMVDQTAKTIAGYLRLETEDWKKWQEKRKMECDVMG